MRTYEELMEDEELDLETDTEAMMEMANCFLNGNGCDADEIKGKEWLKKAAESGHAEAQSLLEAMVGKKEELSKPEKEMQYDTMTKVQLYNIATKGNFKAALVFADKAKDTMPQEAFQLLKEVVQLDCDDYEALRQLQYRLGEYYENGIGEDHAGVNNRKAYECYSNALELGYAPAAGKLAVFYEQSKTVDRDYDKARELRLKFGTTRDKYDVAMHYMYGQYGEKSLLKALQLFDEIASQGDESIEVYLSNFHLANHKEHCYIDLDTVVQHLREEADHGNVECLQFLMEMYEHGNCIPHDLDQAIACCSQLYDLTNDKKRKDAFYEKRMLLIASSKTEETYQRRKKIVAGDLTMDMIGARYGFASSVEYIKDIVSQADEECVKKMEEDFRKICNKTKAKNNQAEAISKNIMECFTERLQYIRAKKQEERQRLFEEDKRKREMEKRKQHLEFIDKKKRALLIYGAIFIVGTLLSNSLLTLLGLFAGGVTIYECVKGRDN